MKLNLARAAAWALLLSGWVAMGAFALRLAPTLASGFALVALWLLVLGLAASVATRTDVSTLARSLGLLVAAAVTATGLLAAVRGEGLTALLAALLGWGALTALASGVVRRLRLAQAALPKPPITAAALGALVAGLVLGDVGELPALAARLAILVSALAALLVVLQLWPQTSTVPRAPGCRAGLFDCSLPAWPAGAWRDRAQWPTLLAGLAMLPMMATLPLMADACRATVLPPQAMVLAHLAAMFGPALLLQRAVSAWTTAQLATLCAALLALGALAVVLLPTPWDWLALAAAQGSAWGLAWSGQLWAPARRAQQGRSAWHAAAGYAGLTLGFGAVVQAFGTPGVAALHVVLGLAAAAAWVLRHVAQPPVQDLGNTGDASRAARGMLLPKSGRK